MLKNDLKNIMARSKWLLGVLFISFGLSIFYSFYFRIVPAVDALAYDKIAVHISQGIGYRENTEINIAHDWAISRVGPLYEYFLASTYKVFGHHYEAVWILQAILHALSAYLIYRTCLLVFERSDHRRHIGLWAAAILGFFPDLIEISAMLLTETLYVFFTCLTVYLFFLYFKNNVLKTFLLLSLVSGLAILVRPPLLLFLPIIFFYLYKKKEWRRFVLAIIILVLVFLPWTVRNYITYGQIMPVGIAGSLNLWIGNHVGASGQQEGGQEVIDFINKNKIVDIQKESEKRFMDFVFNHPGEFIKLTLSRINKYFSIIRPMGFWFYNSGWKKSAFIASSAVASVFLWILGLSGLIYFLKFDRDHALKYLFAFTVATPLLIFITVVETRYRFQIYPFLAIFSAYFINVLVNKRPLWSKILLIGSAIIVSNGLIDLCLSLAKFRERFLHTFI